MSEAELHLIKARLRGGILNKARRGELEMRLPIGLVHRPDGHVDLDPDQQIQGTLRLVFASFEREGSAMKALKLFRAQGIRLPRRLFSGPQKGDLIWSNFLHSRLLQILHNPRYAGAFVYGRTHTRPLPGGGSSRLNIQRENWQIVVRDVHMRQTARPVLDDNKHVQHPERRGDRNEGVTCENRRCMVLQEGGPALITRGRPGGRFSIYLPTVLGDSRIPTLTNSSLAIRSSPHNGFSGPSCESGCAVLAESVADPPCTSSAKRSASPAGASERWSTAAR